jgi:hypothetical protein
MFFIMDIILITRNFACIDNCYVIICNKFNTKMLDKELYFLIYLSMIDEHTTNLYIESKNNAFSALTLFNINACSCNEDVLTNLNVLDAWYNEILYNIIYATTFTNILFTIDKNIHHSSNVIALFLQVSNAPKLEEIIFWQNIQIWKK